MLERTESLLNEFIDLATKYQAYDSTYMQLDHSNGAFLSDAVERAYIVFLNVRLAAEGSNVKRVFSYWREFHYGESRKIGILFAYIDAVFSAYVSEIWLYRWDAKDRNINLEHEVTCRIFILSGITAKQSFERSGALT